MLITHCCSSSGQAGFTPNHKDFSVSHTSPPGMCLGGTGSWEGTGQGQPSPDGQRDIPPCMCHTQCTNWGQRWWGAAVQELAGHQSGGGEQLHCAALVF